MLQNSQLKGGNRELYFPGRHIKTGPHSYQ